MVLYNTRDHASRFQSIVRNANKSYAMGHPHRAVSILQSAQRNFLERIPVRPDIPCEQLRSSMPWYREASRAMWNNDPEMALSIIVCKLHEWEVELRAAGSDRIPYMKIS